MIEFKSFKKEIEERDLEMEFRVRKFGLIDIGF